MLILVSTVASGLHHTGLFAHSSLLPPACTLPFLEYETLVVSGAVSGGGTIGGYRVAAQDAALFRSPEYPDAPSHLELQVTLSTSHWQPWQDNLDRLHRSHRQRSLLFLAGFPSDWYRVS